MEACANRLRHAVRIIRKEPLQTLFDERQRGCIETKGEMKAKEKTECQVFISHVEMSVGR